VSELAKGGNLGSSDGKTTAALSFVANSPKALATNTGTAQPITKMDLSCIETPLNEVILPRFPKKVFWAWLASSH
jgi:hypothetical protein